MPKKTTKKKGRNYRKEYDNFHGRPEEIKKRSKRVQARRKMEKQGKVKKGDSKDIDHKKTLKNGGSNAKSNLRVKSKAANRSYSRKKNAKKYGNGKRKGKK